MRERAWFERTFEFNMPVELFPNVVERVRGTPARLEEVVRGLPPEILTVRPEEAWSIQEHAGHLYDLDELHEGRLDDFDAGLSVLRAADVQNRKTYEADHNSDSIENILAMFREARTRFVRRLEQLDDARIGQSALHPRLQKQMRVIDLAYFVAEHDDHHLAEITRIVRTMREA